MFEIGYKCPFCGAAWTEEYECACDSECPDCEAESIEPLEWRKLKEDAQ